MHDNARQELANKGYFDDKPYKVLDFPRQSLDLNAIENMWAIMKNNIFDRANEIDSVSTLTKMIEKILFHYEIVF
jgi:hypothetical protein